MMNTTWVCIGSGPSLTKQQIAYIKSKLDDCYVIAVNNSYQLAPWCDMIFAADRHWWKHNISKVPETADWIGLEAHNPYPDLVEGLKFTTDPSMLDDPSMVYHGNNSGTMAVHLAYHMGAEKIVLVGYDFQHTGGKRHWFGDHDKKFFRKNADDPEKWIELFDPFSKNLIDKGIDVVNCSIETAIESCRKSTLKEEI